MTAREMTCSFCGRGSTRIEVLGELDATHHGPFSRSTFNLVHCRNCDVVGLDPLPLEQDLNVLYEQSEQFSNDTYTDDARVEAMLDYYGNCIENHRLMPAADEASLEVGAGRAWVSRAVRLRDEAATTVAQDVSDECAKACPWVDEYLVGPIEDIDRTRRFRLISLTHVIEHLKDPAESLRVLTGLLVPGGRMLITAPYRPVGWKPGDGIEPWRNYAYMHVPAHIAYLSQTWFEQVGERVGFRLVHWDAGHEDGQAFEAVLEAESGPEPAADSIADQSSAPDSAPGKRSWLARILGR